eukprot:Colp12_sorted_trinity150504_noHs@25846
MSTLRSCYQQLSTQVHSSAVKGYAGAKFYNSSRPSYPSEAVDWMFSRLGVSSSHHIVEVGAGTGKFTEVLAARCSRVTAVEPVDQMREELKSKRLDVEVVKGTAANLSLADNCADAVLCGQAFHWFATHETMAEFHRILKTGGGVGLVWNTRDTESYDWVNQIEVEAVNPYYTDEPRQQTGEWKEVFKGSKLFSALEAKTISWEHRVGTEDVVNRITSISAIAMRAPSEVSAIARRVRAILAAHPMTMGKTELALPYRCDAFIAHRI